MTPWGGPGSAPEPNPSQVAPPAPTYREEDIDWYPVPPEYQGCVRLGTVHTDEQCPLVVLRFANEGGGWLHIEGSVIGLMNAFAFLFGRLSRIACMAEHYHGPPAVAGPARPDGTGGLTVPIGERIHILIEVSPWAFAVVYLLDALVGGVRSALRRH